MPVAFTNKVTLVAPIISMPFFFHCTASPLCVADNVTLFPWQIVVAPEAEIVTVTSKLSSIFPSQLSSILLHNSVAPGLIKLLASWPKTLTGAARFCEPQRIAYYLIEVASHFHSIWNLGKENNEYRFNIEEDIELTAARLALVESVRKIIAVGFSVMGVQPIDKM